MIDLRNKPNPGSNEAVKRSCSCARMDNGDGKGYNTPTSELLNQFTASATVVDKRREFNIGEFAKYTSKTTVATTTAILTLTSLNNIKVGQFVSGLGITGSTKKVKTINPALSQVTLSATVSVPANTTLSFYTSVYPNKYISPTVLAFDAENDVPVLRYSDVLLMKAEADGNSTASMTIINQIRARAGFTTPLATTVTIDVFEKALSLERKLEFAFENQRWFDLLRFNTTFQNTANKAEGVMDAHFTSNYSSRITSKFKFKSLLIANSAI